MAWHELGTKKETKKEYIEKIRYKEIIAKKAKSFMEIVGADLLPNVQYRFVTSESFNAISVLEYVSQNNDLEEIYIAVYRMNLKAVNYLKDLISNSDITATIVLSSFFRENKRYERWSADLIAFGKSKENVRIDFAWNHAKVFLAKTKTEPPQYIVFEGSGNLSDNARIEQYIIEDNEKVYNFHAKWINDLLGQHD